MRVSDPLQFNYKTTMASDLEFLFTTTNEQKLQAFFDQNPTLDISKFKDDKRNTVLHQAAFQNNLSGIKLFINQIRRVLEKEYWDNNSPHKKSVKQSIQAFVNEGNNEGYTCMHYASYKGNIEMIKFLEGLGANVLMLTKLGLNCLHLASQGDQITSALYFYDKFDINSIDNKKGTPLHWAAYVGSEDVANFLLAQEEVEVDAFDSEDQTPLHLAVLYGNTSIVKRLLIKGADRHLPNGKGQRPIDIARSNQFRRIEAILNDKYTLMDHFRFYCNIRVKYQPQQRSCRRVLNFVLLFLIAVASTHLLIVPKFEYIYLYIGGGFNIFVLIMYFGLLIQPSIQEPLPYKELISQIPICPECKIPKLSRMHHCDICRRCIKQYDHHCPWINGCVGKHNIKLFPWFVGMLILSFCEIGFLCVIGLFNLQSFVVAYRVIDGGSKLLEIVYRAVFGIVLCIIALFFSPICYLFYVQISNILYGKTTFQRFGGRRTKAKANNGSDAPSTNENSVENRLLTQENQEQQRCSFRNCRTICCNIERVDSLLQD